MWCEARPSICLVPAEAEIVIEGFIDTEFLEPEAPFGESHGYVNLQEYNAFMNVTAITRRRNAILTSFISQVTPSESSVIRRVAMEPVFLHHLQSVLAVKSVKRVAMHEPLTSLYAVIGIQFARGAPETEIWRALDGASTLHRFAGKWIIAVDEDIDPHNADALFWAMSYRCQPQHDLLVVPHKHPGHGPRGPRDDGETATVLINATLKGTFAPVALPQREFMERAKLIWERLGLPALKPESPWHGYDLGYWPEELDRQARMAAASDYFALGREMGNQRRNDVAMNTPVEREEDRETSTETRNAKLPPYRSLCTPRPRSPRFFRLSRAPAQDAKANLKPWHDGVVEAKSDAGFVFMASKGGFAESEGLDLNMIQFKGDALALRGMLAGELDTYEGNPGAPLIAASRGADIKIIGCYWPVLTNGIFVHGNIASVADLKGKAFAISSPGALPDLFARAVLEQNGLTDSDVKFAVMGSDADRFRALSAGIADAAVISTEFEPIAAQQGIKLLVHPHDAAPNYLRFCIYTTQRDARSSATTTWCASSPPK